MKHLHPLFITITAEPPQYASMHRIEYLPDSSEVGTPTDAEWDAFLERTECGHFQQSSHWARVKASEGWHGLRCLLERSSEITGGFQLLWKPKYGIRIGYISKGPVSNNGSTQIIDELIESALQVSKRQRLAALILQPPDRCNKICYMLPVNGFSKIPGNRIVRATGIIDVNKSLEEVQKQIWRTTRKHIRQAGKRGVTIREGTTDDLGTFFQLMIKTCIRQKTKPNPSSPKTLQVLWNTFSQSRKIRLTLAEVGGSCIAGLICIGFGNRLSIWKKGSDPDYLNTQAMSLLYWEALEWAKKARFQIADFCAMNRNVAQKLLSGIPLTDREHCGRDRFNISFGSNPEILSSAYIRFKNPIVNSVNKIYGYFSNKVE